jgi:hypothetical protein
MRARNKGVTPLSFLETVVPIKSVITFLGLAVPVPLLSVVNVPVSLSFV